MHNLLIIDDEPIITNMLYDMFCDIKEPELDVYKAYSGVEALKVLMKTQIDIILTDISMPGMNGIEVQKEIRKQWPHCKVIFLTGFNEFDYVQAAIRNDGLDYVLKTEGEDVILEAVKRAVLKLEKEIDIQKTLERAKSEIQLAIPILRSKYLSDLIDGSNDSIKEIERNFKEFEIPINSKIPVLILLGHIDYWNHEQSTTERMETIYGIQKIAENYLNCLALSVSIIYERSKLLWFIQPKDVNDEIDSQTNRSTWDPLIIFVSGMMGSIQQSCKSVLGVSISFILSREPVSWESVSEINNLLELTLSKESGLSHEMLLIENNCSKGNPDSDTENRDNWGVRAQLKKIPMFGDLLENGQCEEFLSLYENVMSTIKRIHNIDHEICMEAYYSISLIFMSHINRWKLVDKLKNQIDLEKLYTLNINLSWEEITDYFRKLAECIFEHKKYENFKNTNRIFGYIRNYTAENLSGDLSLTKFAEMLHFHPFYLSRLFKQVIGKSLSEYISGVKLEKAKELLRESNLKINEIAIALGFDTASYFTRFFKKNTNMTPQEYRNLIENQSV